MPFTPNDLPWWGWLLSALAAWFVAVIASSISDDSKGEGCLGAIVAVLSGIAGLACAVIGVIRFVKWVWVS